MVFLYGANSLQQILITNDICVEPIVRNILYIVLYQNDSHKQVFVKSIKTAMKYSQMSHFETHMVSTEDPVPHQPPSWKTILYLKLMSGYLSSMSIITKGCVSEADETSDLDGTESL